MRSGHGSVKKRASRRTKALVPKLPLSENEQKLVISWEESRALQVETLPQFEAKSKDGNVFVTAPAGTAENLWKARLAHTFGDATGPVQDALVNQLGGVFVQKNATDKSIASLLDAAVGQVHAIAPKDPLEAMLAVQMVTTQRVAMELLSAGLKEQPIETAAFRFTQAARLMRLFATQVDTLQRYRGKGPSEQKVTVEHVHVHDGGQAIVGSVSAVARGVSGEGGL